jgi:hypothetical protein
MTLKDKFIGADRYSIRKTTLADRCEQIADEFAIGFAEWITQAELPLEELLKTYKKEKGL